MNRFQFAGAAFLFLMLAQSGSHALYSQRKLTEKEILQQAEQNVEIYRMSDARIKFIDENWNPLEGLRLEIRQITQDFLFGALAFDLVRHRAMEPEREMLFKEQFTALFNFAILPFYWGSYEPVAGHPGWDRMEPVVEWCLENGIRCKGHPLGWTHRIGLPDYVLDLSLEDSETLLHARILENVKGFKDRITMWDVVNEPVNTVTWETAHADTSKEQRYRRDVPIDEIADWVERAYRAAYRADPENEYILNEFRQIADPEIRRRFHDLTAELLERGTPIHGLGLQVHEPRAEWFDPADVWETLEAYSAFGMPLHITEFSPQSGGAGITGGYRTGYWTPETQAEYAGIMYRIFFGHPSVVSINWWGFSDANAWLLGCGFVDEQLQPKPVYHTLKRLIREEWMTPVINAATDPQGEFSFRGFHGQYEVVATGKDGEKNRYVFHVTRDGTNEWVFHPARNPTP